jgi:hypothetical protein
MIEILAAGAVAVLTILGGLVAFAKGEPTGETR